MPYYLVYFTLTQKYYDATPEERVELPRQEVEHGKKLFKVGVWKHAYTVPGDIKAHDWGIFKTSNQAVLERYLAEYPMAIRGMYDKTIYEIEVVDPHWTLGLLFRLLRTLGLYRPWTPKAGT